MKYYITGLKDESLKELLAKDLFLEIIQCEKLNMKKFYLVPGMDHL